MPGPNRKGETNMTLKRSLCGVVVCCSIGCLTASAQEVVHALQGKVVNLDQKAQTLSVTPVNGATIALKDLPEQKATDAVEKDLRAEVVPADKFTAKGHQVVLLYEGYGDQRTAVAVHDLGATVTANLGTVERYDKHGHVLTIKTAAGKELAFHVNATTIADAPEGATDGLRFEPSKGDHVTVASTVGPKGNQLAVFIGPAD
jgi:hypothetical protein